VFHADVLSKVLEYPQLHEESIPELSFFRATSKLMGVCGLNTFTTKDIFVPDAKRFRRQLSAVINFAKFREEHVIRCEELQVNTDKLVEQRERAREENAMLKAELKKYKENVSVEEPVIAQLEQDCTIAEEEVNELNKQQAFLRHTTAELKVKNAEARDAIASTQFEILGIKQDIEKMRAKIVQSPEKLQREIEDLERAIECDKEVGVVWCHLLCVCVVPIRAGGGTEEF
jgi:kinetochore protein Nuf2